MLCTVWALCLLSKKILRHLVEIIIPVTWPGCFKTLKMAKQKLTAEEKADNKKGKTAFLEMVRRLKKKGALIGEIEIGNNISNNKTKQK